MSQIHSNKKKWRKWHVLVSVSVGLMEVSDEVLKGLEICKNLSDELFQSLTEQAFKSLNSKDELSELISSTV
jgi:hypothetical protein